MKYAVVILAMILCYSCSDKKAGSNLNYPIEKVEDVMIDLYIASEAVKDLSEIKKDSLLTIYKSQIEQIHRVEFSKVESDIIAVRSDPSLYADVHSVVNDSLNSMEKKYQKIPSPDKRFKRNTKEKPKPISFDNVKKISGD
ncbi:hypothetical protein N9L92_02900 [Saprospiraceae bacterium]|nr:hypothetical protein [Saprospiraceae bacterium]